MHAAAYTSVGVCLRASKNHPSPEIPARHFCLKRTASFTLAPPLTHRPCSTVHGSISLLPLICIHIQHSPLAEHSSRTTLACLTPVKGILITQSFLSRSPTPEFSFLFLSVFSMFSSLPILSFSLSPTHNLLPYPSVPSFSWHINRLVTKVHHLRPPLTCEQLLCETLIYSRCTVILITRLFGHTFLSGPPRTVHHFVKFWLKCRKTWRKPILGESLEVYPISSSSYERKHEPLSNDLQPQSIPNFQAPDILDIFRRPLLVNVRKSDIFLTLIFN